MKMENKDIIVEAINDRIIGEAKGYIIKKILFLLACLSLLVIYIHSICTHEYDTVGYIIVGFGIVAAMSVPISGFITDSRYYAVGKILESEGITNDSGLIDGTTSATIYTGIDDISTTHQVSEKISIYPVIRNTLFYAVFSIVLAGIALFNIDIIGINTAIFIITFIAVIGTGLVVSNLSDIKRLIDDK